MSKEEPCRIRPFENHHFAGYPFSSKHAPQEPTMDTAAAEITNNKMLGWRMRVGAFVELTKPRIAFMLLLTSAAGFYLGTPGAINFVLFVNAMIGIGLLAFGVATLNQYVERATDALMDRTKNRPLPSSRLTPIEASIFSFWLIRLRRVSVW